MSICVCVCVCVHARVYLCVLPEVAAGVSPEAACVCVGSLRGTLGRGGLLGIQGRQAAQGRCGRGGGQIVIQSVVTGRAQQGGATRGDTPTVVPASTPGGVGGALPERD